MNCFKNRIPATKTQLLCCLVSIVFFCFCSNNNKNLIEVNLNTTRTYQQMEGFGASDAWRCQFIGKNWPITKRKKIAEWLFSKEVDSDGNPKGIGLTQWRFYIGAGTTEQGDSSNIKNEWRRSESFIDNNGNYNWSKQKGQQWFLKQAKNYGVNQFLAFSIAPPVQWSLNGMGYNSDIKTGNINLQEDKFDEYAKFMVNIIKHFQEEGITFNYLSPVNEPQWNWETKTQEGTPANNHDILKLSNEIDKYIQESNLTTKIVLAEAADLRWLYSDYNKPKRGSQIDCFFNKRNKINSLKNTITGHSYFTTWPIDTLISVRQKLKEKLSNFPNLNYWQSEFCILEKNPEIEGGWKRDLEMPTALYVARVIHADITIANATSWQWWTSLTGFDFKDGLIYLHTGIKDDMYNLDKLKFDGNFHDSKLLWAFGNFSRFIKPNMIRVEVNTSLNLSLKEEYKNLMLSAYLDEKEKEIALVAINPTDSFKKINLKSISNLKLYTTSESKNLELSIVQNEIALEPNSVNTITGKLE